ncbi:MAG TPA: hypothetical protein VMQ67_07995, partial [Candidatus Saccharimonadales bacterium]|nr:hypothetical protein [Candidatus Saccharimonadales bacterium]
MKTVVPGPQGFQGVPGGTGGAGGIGPPGPAGLNWMGQWNFDTNYVINDAVSYGTQDWISINPSTNIIPGTNSVYWQLLVDGQTGLDGP